MSTVMSSAKAEVVVQRDDRKLELLGADIDGVRASFTEGAYLSS